MLVSAKQVLISSFCQHYSCINSQYIFVWIAVACGHSSHSRLRTAQCVGMIGNIVLTKPWVTQRGLNCLSIQGKQLDDRDNWYGHWLWDQVGRHTPSTPNSLLLNIHWYICLPLPYPLYCPSATLNLAVALSATSRTNNRPHPPLKVPCS